MAETQEERRARRLAKAENGDFSNRLFSERVPKMIALVRDSSGRPRFDKNPRTMTPEMRRAYASMMTREEAEEVFGDTLTDRISERPRTR